MEYQIVEATRWLKSQFFDAFFNVVSWFGTELFFLIVFTLLYWAYKREYALKFGLFYLISVGVNGLLKVIVNRTRPNGGEHSFPSGHSQSYAVQATMIGKEVFNKGANKRNKILIICELVIGWIVIAYARMYLNFHFLTDVLAGLLIAILLVFVCDYIWSKLPDKLKTLKAKHIVEYVLMILALVLIIVFSVKNYMMKGENYLTIYELAGAVIGVCIGDLLNDRFVQYDGTVDKPQARLVKCLLGLGFMAVYYYFVIIKFATKLAYLLPIFFLLMMFLATFVMPLVFKKWTMEEKRIENFEKENKDK